MSTLIADSGATKTDWLYVNGNHFSRFRTQGLHPAYINLQTDLSGLATKIGHLSPENIRFFGTGCGNPESDKTIHSFLRAVFPDASIHIKSDLEGAGTAFFGNGSGVVAVLGTGSICAKIEAGKLVKKSAALGFAIGDEGSAADLARRMLKTFYRNTAGKETLAFIAEKLNAADYPAMMNRIYGAEKPNRELASIAGQILQPPIPQELTHMITDAFSDFIKHQLSTLNLSGNEPVVFTGKVAQIHQPLLVPLVKQSGYSNVTVAYPVISSFEERIKAGKLIF